MNILISKKTSPLINGKRNAKEYPFWDSFYKLVEKDKITEIDKKLDSKTIIDLVNSNDVWISTDSFLPHFCSYHKLKPGIVIWGKSDPDIFGYKTNLNLLKDRKYLREYQYLWWQEEEYDENVFISAEELYKAVVQMFRIPIIIPKNID